MARRTERTGGAPSTRLCVYCRLHAVHPDWKPFCSERCQLLDLSHWLDGDYRVPGSDTDTVPDDEDDEPSRPPED